MEAGLAEMKSMMSVIKNDLENSLMDLNMLKRKFSKQLHRYHTEQENLRLTKDVDKKREIEMNIQNISINFPEIQMEIELASRKYFINAIRLEFHIENIESFERVMKLDETF